MARVELFRLTDGQHARVQRPFCGAREILGNDSCAQAQLRPVARRGRQERMHHNVVAAALADKPTRIAWSVLYQERDYEPRI